MGPAPPVPEAGAFSNFSDFCALLPLPDDGEAEDTASSSFGSASPANAATASLQYSSASPTPSPRLSLADSDDHDSDLCGSSDAELACGDLVCDFTRDLKCDRIDDVGGSAPACPWGQAPSMLPAPSPLPGALRQASLGGGDLSACAIASPLAPPQGYGLLARMNSLAPLPVASPDLFAAFRVTPIRFD